MSAERYNGVVVLEYQDLVDGKDLTKEIEAAYGYEGIGLLTVKNVPGFVEMRKALLPLASQFALLDETVKEKYVHEASKYSFGWSAGKEVLVPGKFDTYKGSYYNNPQYDDPSEGNEELRTKFKEVCTNNIWPKEELPKLEFAFKDLGRLIVRVGEMIARQCDNYVKSKIPDFNEKNCMETIIRESRTCKARLLHYFAIKDDQTPRSRDSWCGWHNDFGTLTGLCPAMYMKDGSGTEEVPLPDPDAGLYVRTRNGKEFKVVVPSEYLAFQIGESSQVQSGGFLRATPHAVQAIKWPDSQFVARNTFAVFMQPNHHVVLQPPNGKDHGIERYKPGMDFGEFARTSIQNTYQ